MLSAIEIILEFKIIPRNHKTSKVETPCKKAKKRAGTLWHTSISRVYKAISAALFLPFLVLCIRRRMQKEWKKLDHF